MKNTLFIIVLLLINNYTQAKEKPTFAENVKKTKLIIGLIEYPECADEEEKEIIDAANSALLFAVNNYWTFTEIADTMPARQAYKYVKKNKGQYSFIALDLGIGSCYTKEYKNIHKTEGDRLQIYYPGLYHPLQLQYHDKKITNVDVVYTLKKHINDLERELKKEIWDSMEAGPLVIKKTLLIPKEFLSDKISESDIKLAYPYDFDICDLEKVHNAILNNDNKYASVFFVPHAIMNGGYEYRMEIVDTENGFKYGFDTGKKVTVSVAGVSVTKVYITERELKILGETALGREIRVY